MAGARGRESGKGTGRGTGRDTGTGTGIRTTLVSDAVDVAGRADAGHPPSPIATLLASAGPLRGPSIDTAAIRNKSLPEYGSALRDAGAD